MKIKIFNIEYSNAYKAVLIHNCPSKLIVDIPDTTIERDINTVVFSKIAEQYTPEMALNIETAEFSVVGQDGEADA